MLDELDTNNFIASFDADDADLDVSFDLEPTPLQPFQSGADLGDEPAPIVPTADPAGAAIPQPRRSDIAAARLRARSATLPPRSPTPSWLRNSPGSSANISGHFNRPRRFAAAIT